MKKWFLILLLMSSTGFLQAKDMGNLADILDIDWGAYTSAGIDFGDMGFQYPASVNWRVVLLMDHVFAMGVTGRHILGQYTLPDLYNTENAFLKNNVIGFVLGAHIMPRWPIHLSTYLTLGSGGIGFSTVSGAESTENYFVLIPEVNLEFRLNEFIQFALETRYVLYQKFTSLQGLTQDDINGFYWGISIRTGAF